MFLLDSRPSPPPPALLTQRDLSASRLVDVLGSSRLIGMLSGVLSGRRKGLSRRSLGEDRRTMVRIIDKIIARREEYAWERDHQPPNDDVGGDQRHDPSKIEPPGWDGDCDEAQQQDPNKDIKPGWYYSFEYFPPKTEAGVGQPADQD
ncbi:hypothetical protein THAOC_25453 [Thalassiosira oceanica]|uniref:Uncharacterized protein n=1 Tax=Thalassiosira oceanica TaxID=159749 RepID=K0RP68_THAOC|nr:hypothetical protein THAOC_25453 [Thalassiosira oceanica]|eukprot:EJK54880.1 hypothetical protein THAOC_25453 [Thalassiosira oceanica]